MKDKPRRKVGQPPPLHLFSRELVLFPSIYLLQDFDTIVLHSILLALTGRLGRKGAWGKKEKKSKVDDLLNSQHSHFSWVVV